MTEKKILLPTDGTKLAYEATEIAIKMAKMIDAEVTVLHVIDSKLTEKLGDSENDRQTYSIIKKRADDAVDFSAKKIEDAGIRTKRMVVEGKPNDVIVRLSNDYSMIVMGTAGKKSLSNFLLGSVADSILENAICPVITVKSK